MVLFEAPNSMDMSGGSREFPSWRQEGFIESLDVELPDRSLPQVAFGVNVALTRTPEKAFNNGPLFALHRRKVIDDGDMNLSEVVKTPKRFLSLKCVY